MNHRRSRIRLTLLAVLMGLGCATAAPPPPASAATAPASARAGAGPARSLYDRLGGKPAITAVVDEFVARLAADARINARFANADLPHLRAMLTEQICQATGGPCRYTGKDMKTAHVGMQISGADFDALVGDLQGALDKFKVPAPEQHDLLGALAGMKPDVVEPPGAPPVAGADPVPQRARDFREAAGFLDKADGARLQGNRSLADELFSAAELLTGPADVADLASLFRAGAPPRVTTPLGRLPLDTPPQPAAVGSSELEEPDAKPSPGSLSGVVVLADGRPLSGLAVVTLEPATGKFRHRTPKQRFIEQRNRTFAPHVLAIPVGSTVSFPNFDSIFHNVFSRSGTHPFDLGIYKGGQARQLQFDTEGVVRIGCNLHANMSAYVVVVSAPHYVITDGDGRFAFRSLEPGRYRLRAWSETSDAPSVAEITVNPDRNTVTVKLPAARVAGPLADKFGAPRGGAPPR